MIRYLIALLLAVLVILGALTAFGAAGSWVAGVTLVVVVLLTLSRASPVSQAIIVLVFGLATALFPALQAAREAARRSVCGCCAHNAVFFAMHSYHDLHGTFPPAFIPDEDGHPKHSWRVLLLPYLDRFDLYQQYDFDEPWNGPNNRLLAPAMPHYLRCPANGSPVETGITNYVALVGPETAWPGAEARTSDDFAGEGKTIILVETFASDIHWMEPRDLTIDEFVAELAPAPTFLEWRLKHPPSQWRYHHCPLGRSVLLSGRLVRFVPGDLSPEAARALAHIDGEGAAFLDELRGRERLPAVLEWLPFTDGIIRTAGFFGMHIAAVALLVVLHRQPRSHGKSSLSSEPPGPTPADGSRGDTAS